MPDVYAICHEHGAIGEDAQCIGTQGCCREIRQQAPVEIDTALISVPS